MGRGRTVLRWTGRGFLILIALVLAAVLAVLLALRTDWGREQVRERAETAIQDRLRGKVSIGALEGSLLEDFTARDVVLRDEQGEPVVRIDRLRIDYDPLALMSQHFDASEVVIEGADVWDRGTLNELVLPTDEEPSAWVIDVDRLRVSDSRYRRTRPGAEDIVIEGIALAGSVHREPDETRATLTRASAVARSAPGLEAPLSAEIEGEINLAGEVIEASSTTLHVGASRLVIESAEYQLSSGALDSEVRAMLAASDIQRLAPEWRSDVSLAGTVTREPAPDIVHLDLSGSIGTSPASVSLSIEPGAPAAVGRVAVRDATPGEWLRGAPMGQLDLSADIDVSGASLETLTGTAEIQSSGTIAGAEIEALAGTVTAESGSATADFEAAELAYAGAVVRGASIEAQASALAESPKIIFEVSGKRVAYREGLARDLVARGRLDTETLAGRATVTADRVRWGEQRVGPLRASVRSRDRGDRISGTLRAGGGEPAEYQVALTAEARRRGGRTAVEVSRLVLGTREIRWRGAAELTVGERGAIRLSRFALRSEAGAIEANGRVGPDRRRGAVSLAIRDLDLRRLRAALPGDTMPPLEGRISASADLELDPMKVRAEARFEDFAWQGRGPAISGRLALDTDMSTLEAELEAKNRELGAASLALDLTLPPRPLEPQSWTDFDRARLRSARLVLRKIDLQRAALLLPEPPEVAGEFSGELELARGGDEFSVDIRLTGAQSLPLRQPIDLELLGSGDADSVSAEIAASIEGRRAVRGRLALGVGLGTLWDGDAEALRTASLDADLRIPKLPLRTLASRFGLRQRISGNLTASIDASGTIAEPSAELEIRMPRATIEDFGAVGLRVRAELDPEAWSAEARIRHRGGALTARGRGGTDATDPLRAQLRSNDFDLAVLSPLLARADIVLARATGKLDVALDVAGTLREPEITGKARLRDATARMRTGIRQLEDMWLNVDLDDKRLKAVGSARSGDDGKLALRARVTHEELTPTALEAKIDANRMPIVAGSMRGALSGDLLARGSEQDGRWRIDAQLEDGLVRMPERQETRELHPTEPPEDIRYVDAAAVAARERQRRREQEAGLFRRLRLHFTTPGGFRVISGDGASLRGRADIIVLMREGSTRLSGTIDASSGQVVLFDRKYRVNRAMVSFDGEEPINPNLDVSLLHSFDTLDLYIGVTGTAKEPEVELRSQPPGYSQAELLGFVLGGRPGEARGEGGGGLRAGAASVASSFLAGQLESLVAQPLPFDTVRIGTGDENAGVSSVTVGRWISEDVFLAYQRRFEAEEDENANEAVIEYHFLPRWILEGVVGDRGLGSIDVLWIRRFD